MSDREHESLEGGQVFSESLDPLGYSAIEAQPSLPGNGDCDQNEDERGDGVEVALQPNGILWLDARVRVP